MSDLSRQILEAQKQGYGDSEITQFISRMDKDLATKIKVARKEGYAESDVLAFLGGAEYTDAAGMTVAPEVNVGAGVMPKNKIGPALSRTPDPRVVGTATEQDRATAKDIRASLPEPTAKGIARAGMQMVGAAGGGIVGSGLGPAGTMAGGAGGYAIANQLADITLGDRPATDKANPTAKDVLVGQSKLALEDLATGVAYELVGAGMVKVGKGVYAIEDLFRTAKAGGGVKLAAKKALQDIAERQAAGRVIAAQTASPATAAQVEKNLAENAKVEEAIPGLSLNLGQRGGDPNLLSMSRQIGQKPGAGTALSNESTVAQNAAIGDHIKKVIRGEGDVASLLETAGLRQKGLAASTEAATARAESAARDLSGMDESAAGVVLSEKAKAARATSSRTAKKLYDAVDENLKVDTKPLYQEVEDLFGSFDAATQRLSATPTGPMNRVSGAMAPEPSPILGPNGKPFQPEAPAQMTVGQLKDFRAQMGQGAREAYAAGDYELGGKFTRLKFAVNDTLDQAAQNGAGPDIEALRAASDYWRNVHVPTFRQGATARVLATDKTGAGRVVDSAIGGEYFKAGTKGVPEAVASFKGTFGGDAEAKQAIRDYAAQSLLKASRNPVTGELESKRVARWLYEHKTAIEQHGLRGEFRSVEKALSVADAARGAEAQFNKSAIAKALGEDPDRAIETILMTGTGRKQSIKRLQELVALAKEDGTGAATEGLRAAIGDYFERTMQTTARDMAQNKMGSLAKIDKFVKEYMPAIKASGLYSKEQLNAFADVHKALGAISQQSRPHPGFSNSPTFELIGRAMASGVSIGGGHLGLYGVAKGLYSVVEKPIQNQIDDAVARAVFDPRYADLIVGLARNAKAAGASAKAMRRAANVFQQRAAVLGLQMTNPTKTD